MSSSTGASKHLASAKYSDNYFACNEPHSQRVAGSTPSYVVDVMNDAMAARMPDFHLSPPSHVGKVNRAEEAAFKRQLGASSRPSSSLPPSVSSPQTQNFTPTSSLWARVQREVASWKRGTVSIHDVDPWLQFNVYVRRGFRHCRLRKREAVGSLFLYFHNESFNIFSHLVAALVILSLLLWPPRVLLGDEGESTQNPYEGGRGTVGVNGGDSVNDVLWSTAASGTSPLNQRESVRRNNGGCREDLEKAKRQQQQQQQGPALLQQVPSWLRSLHGLSPNEVAAMTTASAGERGNSYEPTSTGEEESWYGDNGNDHAYVPQSGVTSPQGGLLAMGGGRGRSTAASSSWRFFFFTPFPLSFLTSTRASAASIDAESRVPISVAARLHFSLHPLTLCLLLTFVLSCVYHTFMPCCRSRCGYQQLLQCDVMGVLLSISGSAYAYLTCGMPCASESALLWAGGLVFVSTLCCLYLVVLAPMRNVLGRSLRSMWMAGQGVVAYGVAMVMEFVTSAPLPQPPFASSSGIQPPQQWQGKRGRQEDHSEDRVSKTRFVRTQPSAAYRAFFTWLHEHRHVSASHSCTATPSACSPSHSVPPQSQLQTTPQQANDITGSSAAAAMPAEPEHISAYQRASVMGVYCTLHLAIYRWFVYPKSQPAFGGFTEGIYYHNLSYLFLFIGGLVNAARFPERMVFHWTRKAAKHTCALAAEDAAVWCAEEPARGVDGKAMTTTSAVTRSWWHRFSFAKLMVTYVVSATTLDFVGNSHNVWHICTMLSAFSTLLAVCYDCVEYDLVVCA